MVVQFCHVRQMQKEHTRLDGQKMKETETAMAEAADNASSCEQFWSISACIEEFPSPVPQNACQSWSLN